MSGCKGFQPIDLMGSRVVMLVQCLVLAQCSKTSSLTPSTKQNSLGRLNPQGRAEQSSYQNVGAGIFASGVVSRRNLRQGSKTSRDSLRSGSVQPSQVAVVVVAGRGRHEAATAVVDSWAKLFQKQLVVTNTNDTQGFSHKLSQHAINVFRDAATTDEQMKRFIHPKHPWMRFRGSRHGKNSHSLEWHLAQPRFLLGLERLVEWHPPHSVDWYVVVDTDTYIYADRLLELLKTVGETHGSPHLTRIMVGSLFKKQEGPTTFSTMLGGAGVVISSAAVAATDLHFCVKEQSANVMWNRMGSDWRLSMCLKHRDLKMIDAKFMLMVDEKFTCGPNGPQDCSQRYKQLYRYPSSLECPISLHYMTANRMRELEQERAASTKLCLPRMTAKASECICRER